MWLFDTTAASEWDAKGQTITNVFTQIQNALDKLGKPETTTRALTSMEDQARSLQKTMASGMVFQSGQFREQLFESYKGVLKMGGTFEDIGEAVGGLSEGFGRVVFLTNSLVDSGERIRKANGELVPVYANAAESMVALAKGANMTEKEVGMMVQDFIRFEGSQVKSIERMQKISETARKSGLDAKTLLNSMKAQMESIDSYGFKNGVEGLTKMVAQAQQLRVKVDDIGALSTSQGLWDPEKAIETASRLQMLGGSIGDLGSPLKLMNMGMNDVEELQNQMIEMAEKNFAINKKTGEIDIDPLARQRLKEQAEVFGKSLDQYTKIGREAFKAKEVMNAAAKTGFGEGMPKETKDLISSLSEFKGGKMTLDIPGFKTDDLEKAMSESPAQLKKAIEEYQKVADLSDRQIAEKGLTLQETLNRDTRMIRDALVLSLTDTQRQDIVNAFDEGIDKMAGTSAKLANESATLAKDEVLRIGQEFQTKRDNTQNKELTPAEVENERLERELKQANSTGLKSNNKTSGASPTPSTPAPTVSDAAFSTGNKVLKLGKNEMFNFINEDEAVFAPNLLKNLDILKNSYLSTIKLKDMLSQMSVANSTTTTPENTPNTQKLEASGDINININVNTTGTLSDVMKDREFTEKLKDNVYRIIKDKMKIGIEKGQIS